MIHTKSIELISDPEVEAVFATYPQPIRDKLMHLRQLVLDTAAQTEGVPTLKETLRWGEPSYISKIGSTIRMGWKPATPDHYAIYFHCTTSLVGTFKIMYADKFVFESNRAIVFHISDEIAVTELQHCITLALTYHRVKRLPMLGA